MLIEKGMAGNQSQLYEVYFYKVEGSKKYFFIQPLIIFSPHLKLYLNIAYI